MSYPVIVDLPYFTATFPELTSDINQGLLDALNPVAELYVSPGVFKAATKYALGLVIAHQIAMGSLRGGGPVTMDKVGDLQVQQAALSTEDEMKMTNYGLRFIGLARLFSVPIFTSGPGPAAVPPFGGPQPTWWPRPL